MAFSLWLAFFGASVLLAIAPGPDNLFVLMQSAVFGVRAGMIVVLGLATGLLLQTLAAALGIAAVVAAVPALFWAIKCLGAAYLLWLAWQAWTHAKDAARGHDAVKLSGLALWRRGVCHHCCVWCYCLGCRCAGRSAPQRPVSRNTQPYLSRYFRGAGRVYASLIKKHAAGRK